MTMNKERRKVDFEFRKNQALIAKYANDMSITVYIFQLENPKKLSMKQYCIMKDKHDVKISNKIKDF